MSLRDRISEALHLGEGAEPVRDPDPRRMSGDIRTFLLGWDAGIAEMQDRARAVLAVPDEVVGVLEALAGTEAPDGPGSSSSGEPGVRWCPTADDLAARLHEAEECLVGARATIENLIRSHGDTVDRMAAQRRGLLDREATLAAAARNLLVTLEASASTSRLREAIKASTEGTSHA